MDTISKPKSRKNRYIFGSIGLIAVIIIFSLISSGDEEVESMVVERGSIREEVNVTGIIKPELKVDLSFQQSGNVSVVNALVGQRVSQGQAIAYLYNSDLYSSLEQAKASLKAQEANLEELKSGTRPEEISISEIKVANAKRNLSDNKNTLLDSLREAYTVADDSVRNKADQLFYNARQNNPQLRFSVPSSEMVSGLENGRRALESMFLEWSMRQNASTTDDDLEELTSYTKRNLSSVRSFLDLAALALSDVTPNSSISQTTIDSWRSAVATARTSLNASISKTTTSSEDVFSSESALSLAEQELALKEAGSVPEQIKIGEARVDEAVAKVSNTLAQIEKTILRSPSSGVVGKVNITAGEFITSGTPVITIVDDSTYTIEANIAEIDVGGVDVDDKVIVTVDALPGEEFEASMTYIEPVETVIDGVPTYKTVFSLKTTDTRIKSGMTADIIIIVDQVENAIIVPQRTVYYEEQGSFVYIKKGEGNAVEKRFVKTGIRGSLGGVEITEGLSDGDTILLGAPKEEK
ncbi:MAG: hypothetical protein COV70_01960 [Parcubacteria group bacterium CG11_big_fil_rev_8_21_14_0_20_39_22]|nr:MAG: hypothetical protein COV70_01960 [Parcubacteria group bacterium CG11_big_fil_rev_8_21_14_0_20_39_22]